LIPLGLRNLLSCKMLLAEPPMSHFDLHRSDASSVIVHHVAPGNFDRFMQWQEGITAAVEQFPGYRSTEVYPPIDDSHSQWVIVIHFDDRQSLDGWLDSPVRTEWVGKLDRNIADYQLKRLNEGFGPWFANEFCESANQAPPGWKMALSVLLGLYPTVMLLTIFVGPHTSRFGLAVSLLIANAMSVSILQWIVMPVLTRVLKPWLNAPVTKSRFGITVAGLAAIAAALAGMAVLFRFLAK
jgi:antibiotic biosynthesis monooxygenase (ABM) superfamily enzyme